MIPLLAALMAPPTLDPAFAARRAELALACVHREYPNKIAHALNSDADARPPRELTPAFYGCYDWHSSVHGHWLLARLARLFPDAPFAPRARAALERSLRADHLRREAEYLNGAGRSTFERPYGLAWLLTLAQELREMNSPLAGHLAPLEKAAEARLASWLPKLSYPVRSGEHGNTAFALGLALDWARGAGRKPLAALIEARARAYYGGDRACPAAYEPSGEDFLSPCLAEADLMRRVLAAGEFAPWFDAFLPRLPYRPAIVTDASDGKLAHLDGLNLSRAWMLAGIAAALPAGDPRIAEIGAMASAHREAGHWLGSFAVYLTSGRGLPATRD